jgi:hypothetical protein
MAEYYSLIARAVAALPDNTEAARHTLYERARHALVAQLRGRSESEIIRERQSLEAAIRRVEAELHSEPQRAAVRPASVIKKGPANRASEEGVPVELDMTGPPKSDELRGPGGWLTFFCVSTTILLPLSLVLWLGGYWIGFIQTHGYSPSIGHGQLGVPLLADIVAVGFAFFAGKCLWTESRSPNPDRFALTAVNAYLIFAVIFSFVRPSFTYYGWDENPSFFKTPELADIYKASLISMVVSDVVALVWLMYFYKSKRVRNTFKPRYLK